MISILIPAYNEGKSVNATIARCYATIDNQVYKNAEVIVIDDGSIDNTYEKAFSTGCEVLKHPHNIGYGKALKTGILNAKNDIIIIIDSDGTYPIEEIPGLIEEYKKGFDMVVGARTGRHYHESIFKRINRCLLKFLVEFTSGRKIPDINSGLRVFSRKSIIPYFDTLCDSFSFTTSLTLAYMMTGKFVKYVPINYEKRIGSSKVRILKDSVRTLQFVIEAILFYNPIKIFLVFSMLLVFLALISLTIAFFTQIKITYILGIGSLLMAILMFGLGLISVQLKQILARLRSKNVD